MSDNIRTKKLDNYLNRIKNKTSTNKLVEKLNSYINKILKKDKTLYLKYKKNLHLKYKKKRRSIIKLIDENYKNRYIHFSSIELNIKKLKSVSKNNSSWLNTMGRYKYFNPRGLWISCGSDWLKFVHDYLSTANSEINRWSKCKYVYEIVTNNDKILKIDKVKDLINFHKKYSKFDKKLKSYDVDWKLVKQKYNGLIICPYLGKKIWKNTNLKFYLNNKSYSYIKNSISKNIKKYPKFYLEWYRHWETGTGVIWNKKGIKDIILIKKYTY